MTVSDDAADGQLYDVVDRKNAADEQEREAARKRRLSYLTFEISGPALQVMTTEQRNMLVTLTQDAEINGPIRVSRTFDLPTDWLYFIIPYGTGRAPIHGGISPEGQAHT